MSEKALNTMRYKTGRDLRWPAAVETELEARRSASAILGRADMIAAAARNRRLWPVTLHSPAAWI